ncbi:VOC family protein [Streptomyces varsoviensis]|uniref:Glyoxalase n=1 Tax=Streptomyces varsoviensis TaxID=67373 RepID=A0ABR5ISP5_9ACTN|nr:VOC family protein [Streptomyces varsoviensis]KOG55300.1 glyoxalase [Streptomyces varsoviensis]
MNTTETQTTQHARTTQHTPAPARTPEIFPTLKADDAPALIDFLVETVGFLRTAVYEDGGRVAHAQLDWPEGGAVMLGSFDPDGEWCVRPGTFGAYVVTDHVDELYARLSEAGVQIIRELEDQPYGSREFAIADPEGNKWAFGTYRGEPRPS